MSAVSQMLLSVLIESLRYESWIKSKSDVFLTIQFDVEKKILIYGIDFVNESLNLMVHFTV